LLVVYGWISTITHTSWPVFDTVAPVIASYCALVSTALICLSIYIKTNPLPPTKGSLWFTSPVVIAAVVASIVAHLFFHREIPSDVALGFSILGLAGALHRQFRIPESRR
jgi:hypothetical protein